MVFSKWMNEGTRHQGLFPPSVILLLWNSPKASLAKATGDFSEVLTLWGAKQDLRLLTQRLPGHKDFLSTPFSVPTFSFPHNLLPGFYEGPINWFFSLTRSQIHQGSWGLVVWLFILSAHPLELLILLTISESLWKWLHSRSDTQNFHWKKF